MKDIDKIAAKFLDNWEPGRDSVESLVEGPLSEYAALRDEVEKELREKLSARENELRIMTAAKELASGTFVMLEEENASLRSRIWELEAKIEWMDQHWGEA